MNGQAQSLARGDDGHAASGQVRAIGLYILLALLGTAGFFYVNLAAAIVDGLTGTLGLSDAQAGTVMSFNMYGASAGGLIAVFLVRRFRWRPMMVGLLSAVLAMELGSMFVDSYTVLLPLRAADGLVGGTSVGIGLALLARTRVPDRAFGYLLLFQFAFGGLGSYFLPGLVQAHGTWLLFASMAAMDVAAVIAALFVRVPEPQDETRNASAGGPSKTRAVGMVVAALVALFLFQAAQMGLFSFIIRLGRSSGLALPFITDTVGWTTWIGALGSLAVIVFGTRMGRVGPLGVAMVVTLAGIACLYLARHGGFFFAANIASALTWSFVVPYLFGIVAALDRSGRMATLAGFVSGMGLASGPIVSGWLVHGDDYAPVIGVALAFFAVAAIAMLVASVRVDRLPGTPAGQVA